MVPGWRNEIYFLRFTHFSKITLRLWTCLATHPILRILVLCLNKQNVKIVFMIKFYIPHSENLYTFKIHKNILITELAKTC